MTEKRKISREYIQQELEDSQRNAARYQGVADYLKFVLETFDLDDKEAPGTAGDKKPDELAQ